MGAAFAKEQITKYSQLCHLSGLVSAAGGNVSMRVGDRYFITATNAPLRELHLDDIIEVDIDGNVLDGSEKRPSKEIYLHLAVYKSRQDIDSIIHVHPVYSIAYSMVFPGKFPKMTISAQAKLGTVAFVPASPAGSQKLKEHVASAVQESGADCNAILMERHGIIVFAKGMENCYNIAELMEDTAKLGVITSVFAAAGKQIGYLN